MAAHLWPPHREAAAVGSAIRESPQRVGFRCLSFLSGGHTRCHVVSRRDGHRADLLRVVRVLLSLHCSQLIILTSVLVSALEVHFQSAETLQMSVELSVRTSVCALSLGSRGAGLGSQLEGRLGQGSWARVPSGPPWKESLLG